MKQKIRIWLRNFFGFSRTETNGFIILLILMVTILSMPFLSKKIYTFYKKPLQSQNDKAYLNSLLLELKDKVEIEKEVAEEKSYQTFDLNKSNSKQLIQSGFPEFLAERIVKYREKVKPFESKKELLKIYGMDSAFYHEIHPYIRVTKLQKEPDLDLARESSKNYKIEKKKTTPTTFKKEKLTRFDLNLSLIHI